MNVKEIFKKPKIGEVWESKHSNPFRDWKAEVLDIKNGFVQYAMIYDGRKHFNPDSSSISMFKSLFRYRGDK